MNTAERFKIKAERINNKNISHATSKLTKISDKVVKEILKIISGETNKGRTSYDTTSLIVTPETKNKLKISDNVFATDILIHLIQPKLKNEGFEVYTAPPYCLKVRW